MSKFRTTKELAEEALRILKENPETSHEHWERLVRQGIIDREGRVLVCRYFSQGEPSPEAETPPAPPPEPPRNGA
jgi:hypothetical protein